MVGGSIDSLVAQAGDYDVVQGPAAGFGLQLKDLLAMPNELLKASKIRPTSHETSVQKAFALLMIHAKNLSDLLPPGQGPVAAGPGPGPQAPPAPAGPAIAPQAQNPLPQGPAATNALVPYVNPRALVQRQAIQNVAAPGPFAELWAAILVGWESHLAQTQRLCLKPVTILIEWAPALWFLAPLALVCVTMLALAAFPHVAIAICVRLIRFVPVYLNWVLRTVMVHLESEASTFLLDIAERSRHDFAQVASAAVTVPTGVFVNGTSASLTHPPQPQANPIMLLVLGVIVSRLFGNGWNLPAGGP